MLALITVFHRYARYICRTLYIRKQQQKPLTMNFHLPLAQYTHPQISANKQMHTHTTARTCTCVYVHTYKHLYAYIHTGINTRIYPMMQVKSKWRSALTFIEFHCYLLSKVTSHYDRSYYGTSIVKTLMTPVYALSSRNSKLRSAELLSTLQAGFVVIKQNKCN